MSRASPFPWTAATPASNLILCKTKKSVGAAKGEPFPAPFYMPMTHSFHTANASRRYMPVM